MAKCFVTGVELPVEQTYVLNAAAAYRALKMLRQRCESLERLIQQLGPYDDAEVYDAIKRQITIRKDRRLVSPAVAEVLSATFTEEPLFMLWLDWRKKRFSNKKNIFKTKPVFSNGTKESPDEEDTYELHS
ncbi:MAG: hypothetical protein EPN22_01465 [Nitrospirae bacterium]|nr:MAG: hypothetical protein EPN22_01465 [Nitrospirota bacterium]